MHIVIVTADAAATTAARKKEQLEPRIAATLAFKGGPSRRRSSQLPHSLLHYIMASKIYVFCTLFYNLYSNVDSFVYSCTICFINKKLTINLCVRLKVAAAAIVCQDKHRYVVICCFPTMYFFHCYVTEHIHHSSTKTNQLSTTANLK